MNEFHRKPQKAREDVIEVVLFDLGNVILPFNHFQIAQKLSRFALKTQYQDPPLIFAEIFDLGKGLINPYERGEISSSQFFELLRERFDLALSFEDFASIWNEIFTENVEVSEMIRSLKGKKRLGLVSNTNPLHFAYALERFPVVHLFDRCILSHEVGAKKPDLKIFEAALRWASTPPERILFIDDTSGHVEAAHRLGLRAIHFTSARELRRSLHDLHLDEIGGPRDTDGNPGDDDQTISCSRQA